MDLGLSNATAVVVGGGRGMGLATARCLADDGARIAVVGRTQSVLDEAAAELSSRGSPDAFGVVADVTDAEAAQRVFDEVAAAGAASSTSSSTWLGRARWEPSGI